MDCPEIPTDSLADLGHSLTAGPRRPYSAMLELTARCNCRCRHCYLVNAVQAKPEDDLPFEFWDELMDVLVAEQCLWIAFTGGEPLLHRDFARIYLAAKHKGLLPTILTNACLVTEELADLLAQYPPSRVSVSVYGVTPLTYETVTRTPGSYEQAIAGLERLLTRGLQVEIKTVVLVSNRHELEALRAFAQLRSLPFRYDVTVSRAVDGSPGPLAEALPAEEAVALEMADPQRLAAWEATWQQTAGTCTSRVYWCAAGQHNVFISHDGRVGGCVASREVPGALDPHNLLATFRHCFYNTMAQVYAAEAPDEPCSRCEVYSLCPECPPWRGRDLASGQSRMGYGCAVAWARARLLSGGAPELRHPEAARA